MPRMAVATDRARDRAMHSIPDQPGAVRAGSAMTSPEQLLDEAWRIFYLDHVKAEELSRELLRVTEDSPDNPLRGYAWFHVAFAQIRIGDAGVAAEANEQARAAFSRHNDLRGLALCSEVQAIELRRAGRLDEALHTLQDI